MRKPFLILLLSLTLIAPLRAERTKVAQVGMQFLKIGVGARAVGMGEACVVALDDLSAMFWNPGALAISEASGVAVYQTNWICGIKHYAFAGAFDYRKYGTLGISLIYMDYPTLTATRPPQSWEIGQPFQILGEFQILDFAVGVTYSRRVTNKLSVGVQVKYVYEDLGNSDIILESIPDVEDPTKTAGFKTKNVNNTLGAVGFDIGTVYYTGLKSLRFGMTVQHFSKDMKYKSVADYQHEPFSMPLTFKIGMAMEISDLFPQLTNVHQFTLSTDLIHPRDYTERIHIGGEYWLKQIIAIRGGYKFNYDSESLTGGLGVRFGIGRLKAYLDYSMSDFGEYFDNINRINFGVQF
ncbi:PorV/PorQ family protein [candidate division KSB1 bacterium]|nr:PorV/PorQ family protein [candidate division KSB1 bacterium]